MLTKDNLQDLLITLGFVESITQVFTKSFNALNSTLNSTAGGGAVSI